MITPGAAPDAVFRSLADGPPELLRTVLAFNRLDRPPEVDWPPALDGHPLQAAVRGDPRLWSRWPRPASGGFWNFAEESRRLALLDQETRNRLELFWGAAVWAADLSAVIAGDRVRELKRDLGPELYEYALTRGRFHLGPLRGDYLAALAGRPAPGLRPQLQAAGRLAVAVVRAGWPEALQRLSRPAAEAGGDPPPPLNTPEPRRLTWLWLKKILLTEAAPQWQPCFPSTVA